MALNIETIKTLVTDSDLSQEEQDELVALFSQANDVDLEPVAQLFSEDPSWMKIMSGNYRAMEEAAVTQDKARWDKLIEDSEYLLAKVERGEE